MAAIADQVTSLENDHANALAQIQTLTAQLGAMTSAHAALTTTHAATLAENDGLNKYADEIRAMVEGVATSALNMLKAARSPVVPAVAVPVATAAELEAATQQTAVAAEPVTLPASPPIAPEAPATITPVPPAAPMWTTAVLEKVEAAASDLKADVENIPAAVDRMLHHSSAPPVTKISAPVDMTMIVEHDDGGLPIFLRRGTVFDDLARARLAT